MEFFFFVFESFKILWNEDLQRCIYAYLFLVFTCLFWHFCMQLLRNWSWNITINFKALFVFYALSGFKL